MLISGDIHYADLGVPTGREAGFSRPVVVVTAQLVLTQSPNVVHVVPLTTTRRGFRSEVEVDPDATNGLAGSSAAQCQHLRAISTDRLDDRVGHIGPTLLAQIRESIADLLDI